MNSYLKKPEICGKHLMVIASTIGLSLFSTRSQAQTAKDSFTTAFEKPHNNIVKLNLSSWVLYSHGVQMAYERILSPKRSFSVFGGIISFPVPSAIANTSIILDANKEKSGFAFGAEYRFYLQKENKYPAPRGIYIAPFVSYYHFNNQREGHDSTNSDHLILDATADFFNIGTEVGYQFIFGKRFSVDCVMFGPALSSYYFNIKLDGVTSGDRSEKVQAILDALKSKFPLLNDVTRGSGISTSGVSTSWSAGFRFCVMIGYKF